MNLKLLLLVPNCDFRWSEASNFDSVLKKHKHIGKLRKGEVVALVSKTGKQVVFVYGHEDVTAASGKLDPQPKLQPALASVRFRLLGGGTWNPLMLQDYAEAKGIHLIGLPTFKDWMRELKGLR